MTDWGMDGVTHIEVKRQRRMGIMASCPACRRACCLIVSHFLHLPQEFNRIEVSTVLDCRCAEPMSCRGKEGRNERRLATVAKKLESTFCLG